MDRSTSKHGTLSKLGYVAGLGCLFIGAQFAIASTSAITCGDSELDWQGGPTAWSQRKASRASRHLIETFGSISKADVSGALKHIPEGC